MDEKIPQAPSVRDGEYQEEKEPAAPERNRHILRYVVLAVIAIAAVSLIAAARFLPLLQVTGTSMAPALECGDVIVLWNGGSIRPGDLAGFYDRNQLLVKRVIAGPGDRVDIDPDGTVYVNFKPLDEPYAKNKTSGRTVAEVLVPEGRYFVLSDDRLSAADSRDPDIGCIAEDQFAGKVFLRVWPPGRLSVIG